MKKRFTASCTRSSSARSASLTAALKASGRQERVLEVEAPGELPALGDAKRTEQILAVLLDNAVRFTPPGGRIVVRGTLRDRWVEASVTDSGPGIAPEHLSRVFDRFYRTQAARSRGQAGGGTGLGLAIARDLARGLARAQSGELAVENTEGGGATFRLCLPRG